MILKILKYENGKIKVKSQEKGEQKNPKKAEIEKDKTEYAKLKNDRERIDFLASKLGVL